MTAIQDEETQKKGQVVVIYNVCDTWLDTFDKSLYLGVAKLRFATPVRVVACHYCFTDPAFGAIIALISTAIEWHTRARTRLHKGKAAILSG
jgi:hypothetical protein